MSPEILEPEVSVVIGTFQRHPFLRATIASVRDELAAVAHEIIVVDGGSSDGTAGWLARQKDVVTIVQHNRGQWRGQPIRRRSWGYFMNLGFKVAQGRLVCMLSDDCLVIPGAIRNGIRRYDEAVLAGQRVGGVAFFWRNWPIEADYKIGLTFGDRIFVNHGLYVREGLQDVGFADEEGFHFYHGDGDLALRMWQRGWVFLSSKDSYVEHYLDANHGVRASNFERQREDFATYCERWANLGEPSEGWAPRSFVDQHHTARHYWGRRRTDPTYRRTVLAGALMREAVRRVSAR